MNPSETRFGRGRGLVAGATIAVTALAFAAPASAAPGTGTAAIKLAQHDRGPTLSGQGVKVLPGAPATANGQVLTLPVSAVEAGAKAGANADGVLRFQRGKRGIGLSGLRFDLAAATLKGKLGEREIAVFKLGAKPSVDAATGAVGVDGGKLRLTRQAAATLKQALGLDRAPAAKGVGMVWLAARATPPAPAQKQIFDEGGLSPHREPAVDVLSGNAEWGLLSSWRAYVLGSFGPGSVGTISVAEGATATGPLTSAATVFGFPATGGSYEKGVGGATDRLSLTTEGSVIFAKPGHCIIEVKVGDLEVTLDDGDSSIVLDSVYDVDQPAGMSCTDLPPVPTADVDFADLDLSVVTPTYSDGGKTITWSAIPASLTAAGSTAFMGGKYAAGQALDPITVTAEVE